MRRVLLIVIALILYGSLYPWDFHARPFGMSPLWILLHSWHYVFSRYAVWDVAVNLTLYVPLGLFAYLALNARAPRLVRILAPLLLGLVLSASVEMLQLYDDGRDCSMSDVILNGTGTAIGAGLGALYRARFQHALARRGSARLPHLSGALLLVCCWLGYQLFPMFPSLGRTKLRAKLAAMAPLAATSPVETLLVFAEWLTVACLLEGLIEKQTNRVLVLLLFVLPARLLIVSRTVAWADLAGAALALAVWMSVPRLLVRRAMPAVLAVALVLGELAPFHFARARAFNWVPFRGFFQASWQGGFVMLFRKSFQYGSLLWLWRSAGRGLLLPTAAAAVALFALEWVQIYLPGRTPELSDAVLAALMGVLLGLVDKAHA